MMTLDFMLVAAAGMVFVSLLVVSLIIGRKQTGRKVASPSGLIAQRGLENRGAADASENLEQQEPPVGEGTSRHIYDFFA
jgi:hypothetical protein